MSKSLFTPGDWHLEETDGDTWIESEFQTVATCVSNCDARLLVEAKNLYQLLESIHHECCPDVMDISKPTELSLATWEKIKPLLEKICPPEKESDECDGRDYDNESKQYQDDLRESEAPTPYDP